MPTRPEPPTVVIHGDELVDGVVHRRCPNCETTKPLDQFGLRNMRPANGPIIVREQSWCRACRTSGRTKPEPVDQAPPPSEPDENEVFVTHHVYTLTLTEIRPDGTVRALAGGIVASPGDCVAATRLEIHGDAGYLRTWDVDSSGHPTHNRFDVHYRIDDVVDGGTIWELRHYPRVLADTDQEDDGYTD